LRRHALFKQRAGFGGGGGELSWGVKRKPRVGRVNVLAKRNRKKKKKKKQRSGLKFGGGQVSSVKSKDQGIKKLAPDTTPRGKAISKRGEGSSFT